MSPASKTFMLPFLKKEQVAQDTYSFYFDRTKEAFTFLQGQYVRLSLTIKGKEVSHFFTIASSSMQKEYLVITTKIGSSEFKKVCLQLTSGDVVKFEGPMGGFYLDETNSTERVFLAGGIGITPFHSMITYAAGKKLQIPLTLIVSFSTPEEIVYYNELTQIAKEHRNINSIYTVTQPENSQQQWKGETGRISEELIKKYILDISQPIYYIVGPPNMVADTEELLEKMGISLGKIKVEQFTGY